MLFRSSEKVARPLIELILKKWPDAVLALVKGVWQGGSSFAKGEARLDYVNMLEGPCLAPGVIPIFIGVLPLLNTALPQDPDDDAVDEPRVLASISLART